MINYPLPYWYQFTVSGPTLPDFYWNVKSQEERIKKICEDLWKLIQVYKMLVDAANEHEERIKALEDKIRDLEARINELYARYETLISEINKLKQKVANLENRIASIDERMTNLENQLQNLINTLPTQVRTIINEYMNSDEFLQRLRDLINQIVNELLENKMDKVPRATENNIAVFNATGNVKDSHMDLNDLEDQIVRNHIYGTPGQIAMFNSSTGKGVEDTGLLFSERFIEVADEATAVTTSTSKPDSLVYVPES